MSPSATGIAGVAGSVPLHSTRRRFGTTAVVSACVVAGVLLAEIVVTAITAHTATIEATVSTAGSTVCLRTAQAQSLCLNAFHTSHLRLGGLKAGQCVELTYQGSHVSPVTLTGAWTTPCPESAT